MVHPTSILIVDDDAFVRGVYAQKFKEAGFLVQEAQDGAQAYEIVKQQPVDIIFTGIIMPSMTGFELMETLAKDERLKSIPVVISSHRGKEEDKARAEALGARDFIVSGFVSPNEVVARISAALKTARAYVVEIPHGDKGIEELLRDVPAIKAPRGAYRLRLVPKAVPGMFDAELLEE